MRPGTLDQTITSRAELHVLCAGFPAEDDGAITCVGVREAAWSAACVLSALLPHAVSSATRLTVSTVASWARKFSPEVRRAVGASSRRIGRGIAGTGRFGTLADVVRYVATGYERQLGLLRARSCRQQLVNIEFVP